MTFLAPGWIGLAALVSLAAVAIHLIAWRLPRDVVLPTARFVPDEPARLAARTVRPSDLALLALRIAILMAGGLALARPMLKAPPQGSATVIAMERPANPRDLGALRDSVSSIQETDQVAFVVFDTTARVFQDRVGAMDDLSGSTVNADASLTVGLLAAIREAQRLGREHESVRVVLASTFLRGSFDEATTEVRRLWPDSIRVVRIPFTGQLPGPGTVEIPESGVDDPVVAGLRLAQAHGLLRGTSRLVRGVPTAADSAWLGDGRALVVWPRLQGVERVDGVHAGDFTAIGHFIGPSSATDSGRVVARWANGTPAAWELTVGTGCLRSVGFDVPDTGDAVITPAFQRLLSILMGPCGGSSIGGVAQDSAVAALAAPSPGSSRVPAPLDESQGPNRLAALLMALATLLAIVELVIRRGRVRRALGTLEQSA
jgi:hypothetical protein